MGRNRADDNMFASMIDGADDYDDFDEVAEEVLLGPDAIDMDYIASIGKKSQRIQESLKGKTKNAQLQEGGSNSKPNNQRGNIDFSGATKQAISEWILDNPKVVRTIFSECISAIKDPIVQQLIEEEVENRVNMTINAQIEENNKKIVGVIKKLMRG